jgi:hypothetical protein
MARRRAMVLLAFIFIRPERYGPSSRRTRTASRLKIEEALQLPGFTARIVKITRQSRAAQ